MQRHQIYLNPHSVSIIDELSDQAKLSRSLILRMAIDKLAVELAKSLNKLGKNPPKKLFDSYVGSLSYKKRDDLSEMKDQDYLID
jgi:hypothetical protein